MTSGPSLLLTTSLWQCDDEPQPLAHCAPVLPTCIILCRLAGDSLSGSASAGPSASHPSASIWLSTIDCSAATRSCSLQALTAELQGLLLAYAYTLQLL